MHIILLRKIERAGLQNPSLILHREEETNQILGSTSRNYNYVGRLLSLHRGWWREWGCQHKSGNGNGNGNGSPSTTIATTIVGPYVILLFYFFLLILLLCKNKLYIYIYICLFPWFTPIACLFFYPYCWE